MALANVGVLLAQWGYKTLLVDLDLEAPGLENFFRTLIDVHRARQVKGVVDFMLEAAEGDGEDSWQQISFPHDFVNIRLPKTEGSLDIWAAGNRDQAYFSRVRKLDFAEFYASKNGGAFVEHLRHQLKDRYDFVLLDSRTGLTELGGLSTVQLPDSIALIVTATEQALAGGIDIIGRANRARQRLPYPRPVVRVIPVPSRIDVLGEFRLSQQWLDRIAQDTRDILASWLPRSIKPRALFDLIKLPHVAFFSYGESLPVVEQGTTDPAGLGYAYENLAALIAHGMEEVGTLLINRDYYVRTAMRRVPDPARTGSQGRIFISYTLKDEKWAQRLLVHLAPLTRSRGLHILHDHRLELGVDWHTEASNMIDESSVAVILVSPDYLASPYVIEEELPRILKAAEERGLRILLLPVRPSLLTESPLASFQLLIDPHRPLSRLSHGARDRVFVEISRRIAEAAGQAY
jgi:cellulose biosynthesis protein BcsQ